MKLFLFTANIVDVGLNQKPVKDAHSMFKVPTIHCKRCNHEWNPRTNDPKKCPKCGSYNWNTERDTPARHVMVSEEPDRLDIDAIMKKRLREEN